MTRRKDSVSKNQVSFGAVPSPRDYRDVPLASVPPTGALPQSYFEDVSALPVWNQKKIGSCVGHAAAKYKQRLDQIETGTIFSLSPRFLYAMAKSEDGFAGEGTYPRLVAKILKDYGCATEKTVANDTSLPHEDYVFQRSKANIPQGAFDDAKPFKIKGYAFPNIKSADELKQAVVDWRGAIILMQLGEEWWKSKDGNNSWSANDIVPLRPPKSIVSGHEVWLYGYENTADGRTKFYIYNSWSADWGLSGKAWFYFDEYAPFLVEAVTFVDLPNEVKEDIQNLPPAEKFTYTFNNNLSYGQTNKEISALQTALRIDGVYSGPVTGYYGSLTAAGVLAFWTKYEIASWWERTLLRGRSVGPKTRTKLNELFSK